MSGVTYDHVYGTWRNGEQAGDGYSRGHYCKTQSVREAANAATTEGENMRLRESLVTLVALVIGVGVPALELNSTHVLNPAWPGHARLHEVWQLASNTALAGLCLWLAWRKGAPRLAAGIGLCLTGGFMLAYALRDIYDGSMLHTDGSELAVGGVNLAVAIMFAATCALAGVVFWPARKIGEN